MMDSYTSFQLLVAALAAIGGVAGVVKGFSFLLTLWERRRVKQTKALEAKLHDTAEIKRLALEASHIDDEMVRQGLWQIIGEYKERIEKLEKELEESEESHSLSRPRLVKIYEIVRAIRKQANILVLTVGAKDPDLQREVEILMQRLDQLEEALP